VGTKAQAQTRPLWARGIEGHSALVTGAGRGLGRACALALSQAGARVIAVARSAEDLDRLAADAPGPVEAWVEDVRGDGLLARIEALARLDVLVNNAGSNRPQPFLEVTDDALDGLLELNVRAAYRVARSAARVMARSGQGSIIHMSSQMGHVGSPQRSVYCMTKHAIEGLSKAMAVELAPLGITVNCVAPGLIDTVRDGVSASADPAHRAGARALLPRRGHPEEVAAAVVWLAGPGARFVTGQTVHVNGGAYMA